MYWFLASGAKQVWEKNLDTALPGAESNFAQKLQEEGADYCLNSNNVKIDLVTV